MSETPPGMWHDKAQRGRLCYTGSLAERRKSEISGKRPRPKLIPWEKNSLGNFEMRKTRKERQR